MQTSSSTSSTSVVNSSPDNGFLNLNTLSQLTETPVALILDYCRNGIIVPVQILSDGSLLFEEEAVRILKKVQYLNSISES